VEPHGRRLGVEHAPDRLERLHRQEGRPPGEREPGEGAHRERVRARRGAPPARDLRRVEPGARARPRARRRAEHDRAAVEHHDGVRREPAVHLPARGEVGGDGGQLACDAEPLRRGRAGRGELCEGPVHG
jgi:hypothetical protein